MKTTLTHSFMVVCIALFPYTLRASFTDLDGDFDDLLSEDIIDYYRTPASGITPEIVVTILIAQANALNLLKHDLYLGTYPLNNRNPLDFPIFIPHYEYDKKSNIQMQLFWNQTGAKNFSECSTAISSYLAINDPNILEQLHNVEEAIGSGFDIGPLDVLKLFNNTKIQERKLGVMLTGQHHFGSFTFGISAPFYYFERNFFLTPQEQLEIERALGKASEEETFDFAQKHLISDALGLGDTRVSFTFDAFRKGDLISRGGVFVTIPTAFAFASGLMGTDFQKNQEPPILNFVKLASYAFGSTQADKDIATAMAEEFFLGAIDHLSANILEDSLGYRGHFGIGLLLMSETPLNAFIKKPGADDFTFKSRIALQYLLPGYEQRYFVELSDAPEYEALGLNRPKSAIIEQVDADPAYAVAVLDFLQAQTTETFYPFVRKTLVLPGIVFEWTTKFWHTRPRWNWYIGTDTWIQGPENLKDICFDPTVTTLLVPNVEKATEPLAYQSKILGGIGYTVERPARTLLMMLHADATFFSNVGIGQDFTLSLILETNF